MSKLIWIKSHFKYIVSKFVNTSPKIANITNTLHSTRPLQNLIGHSEVLPTPLVDPQEWHLHIKRCKKEGVSIPHCSVGCLTPKGLMWITKFQMNTKETFHHHWSPTFLIFIIIIIPQFSTIKWNTHGHVTHSHTMHCRSRAFIDGYASVPKYTPHSESSQGKLLGISP